MYGNEWKMYMQTNNQYSPEIHSKQENMRLIKYLFFRKFSLYCVTNSLILIYIFLLSIVV